MVVKPHFAHLPGSDAGCSARKDREGLVNGYQHLAMQLVLRAWLEEMGYRASIEHRVLGGRVDVHARADEVAHSLEVQRSALAADEWRRRDAVYRSQASTVTWLWSPVRHSEAELALVSDDVAFQMRVTPELRVEVGTMWAAEDGEVDVGWDQLQECTLDGRGLRTPHREFALAATREWREAQQEAERAQIAHEARQREQEVERRRQLSALRAVSTTRRPTRPGKPVAAGGDSHHLARRRRVCPDLDGWQPAQGWEWLAELPPHLEESARHLAYFVTLWEAGPITDMAWRDVPDPEGLQRQCLVDQGFITISDGQWRRRRA